MGGKDSPKIVEEEQETKSSPETRVKRGRPEGGVFFPRNSLKEAIKIPTTIWEKGAGKPFALQDVAEYTMTEAGVSYSPTGSSFSELVRSAQRYGLIEGSWQQKVTATISLSPLGRSIVAQTTKDDVNASMRTALETPEVFREFLESLHGTVIPPERVCINTLIQNYHIRKQDAKACYNIIMKNIEELNLSKNKFLRLDNLSTVSHGSVASTEEVPPLLEKEKGGLEFDNERKEELKKEPVFPPPTQPEQKIPRQIFVAHGKNKKPLDQATKILNEYKIPYIVAIEEPHRGRPIGIKAAEEMKKCTAGIFIFTADEETKDAKGNVVMRPSDNVVYELGAGSVLYGNKIIILREEGVDLASDYDEIGHITFEKDRLDAKGTELLKELVGFGILKFTVG